MQNKYPLWKNLMLIIIAVVGFIYAIPNLYTENPVVQISSETPVDYDELKNQVEDILKNMICLINRSSLKMKELRLFFHRLTHSC